MRVVLLAVAALCCACAQASVLADLRATALALPSSRAEITQRKKMSIFDETLESKMLVFSSAGGKFRMQTTAPFEAALVFDSSEFARFEKSGGKWRKLETPSTFAARRIFGEISKLLSGNVSESDYEVSESGGRAVLKPKSRAARAVVAQIEIAARMQGGRAVVGEIKITDADGDTTELLFDKIEFKKIPGELFSTSVFVEEGAQK